MIWTICVVVLTALFVFLSLRTSPQRALGIVNAFTFAFPAWVMLRLLNVPADTVVGSGVDIKVAVGTATLLLYCVMPGRNFPVRLIACDYAMLALAIIHLVSDTYNYGFRLVDFGRMYAEWYIPYVAGRVAFQKYEDAQVIVRVVAVVAVLLSVVAMCEAFARVNLMELWAGQRPLEGAYRELERWGMKRAYGPYFHPLYFGVIQCLLFGSTLFVAISALRKQAHAIWIFCPLFSVAGIVCTGSRGPILGAVVLAVIIAVTLVPKVRIPVAILGACLLMAAAVKRDLVFSVLEKWSGEATDRFNPTIEVGGKKQKYSGTRSRFLVFRVYGKAVAQAGLLGYGTDRVTGFPIRVPLSGEAAELVRNMDTVENTYVLIALRFGWLGLFAFTSAIAISVFQWLRLGRDEYDENRRLLTICLGATTGATALVILTVWMPHEIGFPFLWTIGSSSGLFLSQFYLQRS